MRKTSDSLPLLSWDRDVVGPGEERHGPISCRPGRECLVRTVPEVTTLSSVDRESEILRRHSDLVLNFL